MGHKQKRVKLGRDVKAEVDKEWREVDWRGSGGDESTWGQATV